MPYEDFKEQLKMEKDKELGEELHKSIIKKFKKGKVELTFTDNIWGADLAKMQLISKFGKGVRFLCVIDVFSKSAWAIPLKNKRGIKLTNAFRKMVKESNRKPNEI